MEKLNSGTILDVELLTLGVCSLVSKVVAVLRDKTMADKFMYIINDNTQNYPFCRLHFVVKTFGHLMNQPTKIQY